MQNIEELGLKNNQELMQRFSGKIKEMLGGIQNQDKRLVVDDVSFGKPNYDPEDWQDLHEALVHNKTVGVPYYVNARLVDKNDGHVIDKKKLRLGLLPLETKLNTYVVNGSSYNIPVQFRLKAGAYPRIGSDGHVETFHNVEGGLPMRTQIDPEKKKLTLNVRQGSIPMVGVLQMLGATEAELVSAMGRELYDANKDENPDTVIRKAYRTIFKKTPPDLAQAADELRAYFDKLSTYPEVNAITLGKPYGHVDKDYLMASVRRTIGVIRGDESPSNRDNIAFKHVLGPADVFDDTMSRYVKRNVLTYKGKMRLPSATRIEDVIDRNKIDKTVRQFFSSSQITRFADQTNPVSSVIGPLTTTLLGEGGIGSQDLVTDDAKQVQNSSTGFLDPTHTPESSSGGITLTLAKDTKMDKGKLRTKVIDVVTGKEEWLSPQDLQGTFLAYPEEMVKKGNRWVSPDNEVWGVIGDSITSSKPHNVRYMLASAGGMFDVASLSTPFMHSNQGNRLLTSAKMATQAVPVIGREKPLVDVDVDGELYSDMIGNTASIHSPVDGEVLSVGDREIIIQSPKGKQRVSLFHNTPLNEKNFLDSMPRVKPGDKVKAGSLLADSNYTVDGKYAPGVNLTAAYVPWKGQNYNDACVITESAADKLTSEHLHKITMPLKPDSVLDIKKFMAASPYGVNPDSVGKYDPDGVIRPGTEVSPGDTLIAALKKHSPRETDIIIQRMKKSALPKFDSDAIDWKKLSKGIVTDVHKGPNDITVYVKTREPFRVGDKVTGRHGNKMIVSDIIPDDKAPQTASGERIDILIDPLSVPSRINTGQLLETAAGKIAAKSGSPFVVRNFDRDRNYQRELLDTMQKGGIPEKEDIYDPETGKTIPQVFTGKQYVYKLKHQAEFKQSRRGLNDGYTIDDTPTSGHGQGGMTIDNLTGNVLLAHGARDFLREAMTIKNNRNADYWSQIIRGELPQPPKNVREWDKFNAYLKGMGINPVQNKNKIKLTPLTDANVLELSQGEIPAPSKMFVGRGEEILPEKDGLFGDKANSIHGTHFNHINLAETIANPTYKDAIKAVLNLTDKEYDDLLEK